MKKHNLYGSQIEKLLVICGQKNYMLANALGYNESYISKWIKGARLPSPKSIMDINRDISKFIVSNIDESRTQNIITSYALDLSIKNNDNIKSEIQESLENILNEAYKESYGKKENLPSLYNENKLNSDNNGSITISPKFKKDYLTSLIVDKASPGEIEVFAVANLYSLSYNDKLHISGINDYFYINKKEYSTTIKFLINFENYKRANIEEFIFNSILFLNMATIQDNIKFEFYTHDFPSNMLLSAVKGIYMHQALFANDGSCIMTSTSTNLDAISSTYNYIENIFELQTFPTFTSLSPEEILFDKHYSKILLNGDFNILAGEMDETFLPKDIYNDISIKLFGDNPERLNELNHIQDLISNISLESGSKLILTDSMIKSFLETGKLKFFNEVVFLDMPDRIRCVEYLLECISDKHLEFILSEGDVSKGFYLFDTPSLHIYHNDILLKRRQDNKYLLINDSTLKSSLIDFFDTLWNYESRYITRNKDEIIKNIKKTLNIFSKIDSK